MGHVDDPDTALPQRGDDLQKALGFSIRETAARFVKNHDPRFGGERFGDLDQLPLTWRKLSHDGRALQGQPNSVKQSRGAVTHLASIRALQPARASERLF